jgi:TRAP transporter TAXI family solute receptor
LIANAISSDKVNASAVATNGSVANVNAIVGGSAESGFSQSDVASWAYTGTGIYEGRPKVEELRAIANLFPETVHVVVRKGTARRSFADLKGKRISIDEPGSGTIVNARAILTAYGIGNGDYKAEQPEARPLGRQDQGRLARRLLHHHRLSRRRAERDGRDPPASSCCRSTARSPRS